MRKRGREGGGGLSSLRGWTHRALHERLDKKCGAALELINDIGNYARKFDAALFGVPSELSRTRRVLRSLFLRLAPAKYISAFRSLEFSPVSSEIQCSARAREKFVAGDPVGN